MNIANRSRLSRPLALLWASLLIASFLITAGGASAAGWSAPVAISPIIPLGTPNAFATNPAGNQVWLTRAAVTGGFVIQAAQRTGYGPWSAPTNISPVLATVLNLSAAVSANGSAAAAWSTNNGVQLALRSASGVWQSPVLFALTGSILNLQIALDAQGNGVATWTRLTSTLAVVEAITWNSTGTFSNVTTISPATHGSFLPNLAVNDAGTAIVVWQAAGALDNSNPYQVESITRSAGGAWGTVTVVSPNQPQTWTPKVTLDAAGNATVIWAQGGTANNYHIYAATRPAGGAWSAPTQIELPTWYFAGYDAIATDAAGNVTAAWLVEDASGGTLVRSATRTAGGSWSAPVTLGPCATTSGLCSTPQVAASQDGSITVVGWAAYGSSNAPNVAVRLGNGPWTRTVLSSGNAQVEYVLAWNSAHATAIWPESAPGRHKVILKQSDYQ